MRRLMHLAKAAARRQNGRPGHRSTRGGRFAYFTANSVRFMKILKA